MSTLALITIIPLCLLLIMTSVAGLPTEDPTPDLVDRSLPLETRSWEYESMCKVLSPPHCQVGTYTTRANQSWAALTVFDPACNKIGDNDQVSTKAKFPFDSELPFVVDVQFEQSDDWTSIPSIGYKGVFYPSDAYKASSGSFGPDSNLDEYFSLIWFNC
jgi:hypothetical protein